MLGRAPSTRFKPLNGRLLADTHACGVALDFPPHHPGTCGEPLNWKFLDIHLCGAVVVASAMGVAAHRVLGRTPAPRTAQIGVDQDVPQGGPADAVALAQPARGMQNVRPRWPPYTSLYARLTNGKSVCRGLDEVLHFGFHPRVWAVTALPSRHCRNSFARSITLLGVVPFWAKANVPSPCSSAGSASPPRSTLSMIAFLSHVLFRIDLRRTHTGSRRPASVFRPST